MWTGQWKHRVTGGQRCLERKAGVCCVAAFVAWVWCNATLFTCVCVWVGGCMSPKTSITNVKYQFCGEIISPGSLSSVINLMHLIWPTCPHTALICSALTCHVKFNLQCVSWLYAGVFYHMIGCYPFLNASTHFLSCSALESIFWFPLF